jgi:hypothetical protein
MIWRLFKPAMRHAMVVALLMGAVAAASPATAAPDVDKDSVYLDFLQNHGVSIDQPGPLKSTAGEICRGLDDGMTFTEVGATLMQRGTTPHEATIQIFGAVEAYCPSHDAQLNVAPTTRLVHFTDMASDRPLT